MRKYKIFLPIVLGIFITSVILLALSDQKSAAQAGLNTATYYVDADATGLASGLDWTNAYTNLQDALAVVQSGAEIWVAEGVYYPDIGADQTDNAVASTFVLTDGVSIYGGFSGNETLRDQRDWDSHITVLSGDIDGDDISDSNGIVLDTASILGANAHHVVSAVNVTNTAVLDGFIINAGHAYGASPHNQGGGMYVDSGSPTLSNIRFYANMANLSDGRGGGMFTNNNSSPILTDIIFTRNAARLGAGMLNDNNSSPTITNVVFSYNSANWDGGGLYNRQNSNPVLTNVLFYQNTSPWEGGGMHNRLGSSPTLMNVTIAYNQATRSGGGIHNYDNSNPTITNTIIWGNTNDQIFNDGSTPIISYSDIQGSEGSGILWHPGMGTDGGHNIDSNPLFVDSDLGDLHLQAESPVINYGTNTGCPPEDLDGNPRPIDDTCDMGAYEYSPYSFQFSKSVDDTTPAQGATITFTLVVTNTGPELTGGLISDSLPDGLEFLGPITLEPSSAGSAGIEPPTLASSLVISSNHQITVTFPVMVSAEITAGLQLENIATFTSTEFTKPTNAGVQLVILENIPPNAFNDPESGFEADFSTTNDAAFNTSSVLINDIDPDEETLQVKSVDTSGTLGLVSHLGYGVFNYDPNGQFDSLTSGQQASDTFMYTVIDSNGATDTATVTITITDGNNSPDAVNDGGSYFTTYSQSPFWTTSVLINDIDPDGDLLEIESLDTSLTSGLVEHLGYGVFSYDPNGQFDHLKSGDEAFDTFKYTISDGKGGSATATVTITIQGNPICSCFFVPLIER